MQLSEETPLKLSPSLAHRLQLNFWLVLVLLALVFPVSLVQAQTAPIPDGEVTRQVEALLKQMTLAEKIGQLTQTDGNPPAGKEEKPEDKIRRGAVGSVLWVQDPATINRLQHVAVEQSRLHIPILFGLDVIHGLYTIFPAPLATAASWDPKLVEQEQTYAAREASAAGLSWTFAPMVDIARDARWGRIVEGAGEDPYLGSAIAAAQVRGLQGPYLGSPGHVLATMKHYAGYGAADGGRDYDASYLSDSQLWNVYLPPFHAAVKAGVGSAMSAYMDLNDVPASGNKFLLREVLRDTWGFKGFVVSDAFAIRSLIKHGMARDGQDAALKAFTAGLNMDMASDTYLNNLEGLVKQERIAEREIDDMVRPILAAKIRLRLFEHPYVDEGRLDAVWHTPEHRQFARAAAQRTMVLLRNQGELLPLDKKRYGSIAVIGPLADAHRDLFGLWGAVTGSKAPAVSVLEGVRGAVGSGVRVEYAKGPTLRRDIPSFFENIPFATIHEEAAQSVADAQRAFDEAVETARRCDLSILVIGETALMSGEAASRSSLDLSSRQQQLLEAVAALGKPVVLVLVSGRPLNIAWASEHVPAILEAWYPGVEGGNAVADILFGEATPGAKLPVTWPRSAGQEPLYYAHNLTQQPETDPDFKSRYWDLLTSPLYPFGYGLSYSKFAFSNLNISTARPKLGESFRVAVDVENTSNRAGTEVVQLYIHQEAGSASRPVRELKGFQKIDLAPHEKRTVTFSLGKDELSFWSPALKSWVEEAEKFDVWVGEDSTATLHGEFQVVP
jgi:beta-glucosidase